MLKSQGFSPGLNPNPNLRFGFSCFSITNLTTGLSRLAITTSSPRSTAAISRER
ncbi:MAG: hypothetical protein WEB53_11570 [Akkermansiaceae bacterium]